MKVSPIDGKLSLTNNGELQIVFLGVGSAFSVRNNQVNFLIIHNDQHILVDFGMTGPKALHDICGLSVTDINCVLPTHSHADHVGGLECLALMSRYVGSRQGNPKPKMIISNEYMRILWDYTLKGGMEWNEKDGSGKRLSLVDFFDIVTPEWLRFSPRQTYTVNVGGIKLEIFRTNHIPDSADGWQDAFISYGMMINDRIFMSCDSRFDPELINMYKDAEVMFHDCQFFTGGVHASLEELNGLPFHLRQKMMLMHYGDNWEDQDISKFPLGLAQQGMIYEFD